MSASAVIHVTTRVLIKLNLYSLERSSICFLFFSWDLLCLHVLHKLSSAALCSTAVGGVEIQDSKKQEKAAITVNRLFQRSVVTSVVTQNPNLKSDT
jgi:hypothetical protein